MIARLALAGLTLAAALHAAVPAEAGDATPAEGSQAVEVAPAEPAAAPVERKKRADARKGAAKAEAAAKDAAEPVAAPAAEASAAGAQPEAKPAGTERVPRRRAAKAKPAKVEADAAAKPAEAAAIAPAAEAPAGQAGAGEPASAPVEAAAEAEPKGRKAKRSAKIKPARSESIDPTEAAASEAAQPEATSGRGALDTLIAAHAKANGLRESFVHRVIRIESRHNPRAIGRGGVYGLMQIKTPTARALGYAGGPAGLLDPDTNLTYGVRYLAGAYKVAGGDETRAYAFYRSGYYYAAKRKGLHKGEPAPVTIAAAEPPAERASLSSLWTPVSANAADPGR
jgi:soluble lytic murein transglycosylase-like protein